MIPRAPDIKLEGDIIVNDPGDPTTTVSRAIVSQAVSLKRIADALDIITSPVVDINPRMPLIAVREDLLSGGIIGSRYPDVLSVEAEDDGSFTAVIGWRE